MAGALNSGVGDGFDDGAAGVLAKESGEVTVGEADFGGDRLGGEAGGEAGFDDDQSIADELGVVGTVG